MHDGGPTVKAAGAPLRVAAVDYTATVRPPRSLTGSLTERWRIQLRRAAPMDRSRTRIRPLTAPDHAPTRPLRRPLAPRHRRVELHPRRELRCLLGGRRRRPRGRRLRRPRGWRSCLQLQARHDQHLRLRPLLAPRVRRLPLRRLRAQRLGAVRVPRRHQLVVVRRHHQLSSLPVAQDHAPLLHRAVHLGRVPVLRRGVLRLLRVAASAAAARPAT